MRRRASLLPLSDRNNYLARKAGLSSQPDGRSVSAPPANVPLPSASLNREDVDIILERKKHKCKNPEMFQLVIDCFEGTRNTSDYLTALQTSLQKDRDFVKRARNHINGYQRMYVHDRGENYESREVQRKRRYAETLDELRQYSFARVTGKFKSVYLEEFSMFEKLVNKKVEQERKLKLVKRWRMVTGIIFVLASAVLPISSLVVALNASRIAAAIAAAATIPMGSIGKWFDSMFKDYQDALTYENELINILHHWTSVVHTHLDSIKTLVNQLEANERLLLDYAKIVFNHNDPMSLGIEEMMNKMTEFIKSNEDLMQQANQCNGEIRRAGTGAFERIKYLRE